MDSLAREWMKFACSDLDVARHLVNTFHPKPLEIICYHCQQAAEKAVKAVLADLGLRIPRSHDISFLLETIPADESPEEALFDQADSLTPYGVAVRYLTISQDAHSQT